jgi:diguanylate cyclase (GGDEF)-like protein/PAS domain S-box-containing protein
MGAIKPLQRDGAAALRADPAQASAGVTSEATNWVLQRQLNEARRANGELDFDVFLRIVSKHYDLLDQERSGVVRSMQVLSAEAQELARDTLAQSAAEVQNILDNVKDAIVTIDSAGSIETCNPMGERIFGYPRAEILGRTLDFVLPEIDPHGVSHFLDGLASQGGEGATDTAAHQTWCISRLGQRVAVEIAVSKAKLSHGHGFIVCVRDVTERQLAEQLMRESEARNRTLVEHAPEAILVLDVDRRKFVDVNENACRFFKLTRERLLDCDPEQLSAARDQQGAMGITLIHHIDAALVGSAPVFEWEYGSASGQAVHCEVRFVRLPGAHRRLIRISITDITVRKRTETITAGERRVFEKIAASAALPEILDAIARIIESAVALSSCAINILEAGAGMLSFGAAPSLPREFLAAMDHVPVGLQHGSCAAAAHLAKPVLVVDIETDEIWALRREVASGAGLCGAWSAPLIASDGQVMGAFTVYRRQSGVHDPQDHELMTRMTQIAGIALERHRSEEALRASEAKFRGLVESVLEGVYRSTLDGRFIAVNSAFAQMLGYDSADELCRVPCAAIYAQPAERDAYVRLIEVDGEIRCEEILLRRKDGSTVVVLDNCRAVRDEHGTATGFEGTLIDVTERKRAEMAIFEAKERAQVTLQSIGDAVITTDAHGLIDYLNPVAAGLVGWENREALHRPIGDVLKLIDELTESTVECPVMQVLREDRPLGLSQQTALVTRQGQRIDVQHSAAPIHDRDGNLTGTVIVFHDISKERRLHRALHYQACHDALTGLINRREFENRLAEAVEGVRKNANLRHALLYLDLDQFKLVNDTCGHGAGDQLLKQLTAVLQSHIRGADTLGRLGGDEFGILLHDISIAQAQRVAEVLRESIRDYRFIWQRSVLSVGVSIGIVEISSETLNVAAVLSAADIACYSAKDGGRDRVKVYTSLEVPERHREMDWVSKLSRDCEEGRFELYFQPIVSIDAALQDRERFELLAHWRDESGILIRPEEFIPAAERFNLVASIDRWVLRQALDQLAHRRDSRHPAYTVTIGISGNTLNDDRFLEYLSAELTAGHFSPGAICLEITEIAAIANLANVGHFMRQLHACGCWFALDEFGRGLSSFQYLKNLPIDYLKIDGQFIENIASDPVSRSIVQAIASIGKAMGVRTVAERVESREALAELGQLGVGFAQGVHIATPLAVAEFPYAQKR